MHPVTLSPPCRIGTAESPPPGYPGQAIDDKGKRSDSAVIRSRFQTWLAAASVTGGEADLLAALGAPFIAAAGVALTALSVAGAFGIARLIFQDGHLSGLLNFTPQGFVDAWGPLFFGAMVFGVAMDYTLFLLSAAKERYETHADPEHTMTGSVGTSGRVVLSAAAVMIAVFLTFALSGPLAPKEMGVILAVAVTLDALVVRLVLLPVILRLGGHHAWQHPAWLDRVIPRVRFSH